VSDPLAHHTWGDASAASKASVITAGAHLLAGFAVHLTVQGDLNSDTTFKFEPRLARSVAGEVMRPSSCQRHAIYWQLAEGTLISALCLTIFPHPEYAENSRP
jgi:hypothetical protein